ncbi:hypothetical protein [Olleya sp. YS]|uniref:hypothetical protein n=1 Tax=Olleya sp. YS TaxID=3028318 RepID=UPI0024341E86|nr:hypothetical protein [Olleya sp. YS]WGD35431.1 hypothetical protein Ollyesu_03260 [Olleya sp. YS]
MDKKNVKKGVVLSALFFLPVIFLLFLYPSTNNYNPLEVVKAEVLDIQNLASATTEVKLADHITVLGFLGKDPESKIVETSNLKELIYDKFQGFKKFQVVMMVSEGAEEATDRLKKELTKYGELKYWKFVLVNDSDTKKLFNSLRTSEVLDFNLATSKVFIVDKELNQRGRLDDRTKKEIEKKIEAFPLTAYNCKEVSELKNKMGADDLRVLFTEYRQKRKGEFNSTTRRADDLKGEQTN